MRQATAEIAKAPKGGKDITLVEAFELYLIKRSKKARRADSAPMLIDGYLKMDRSASRVCCKGQRRMPSANCRTSLR
jgi:hypothetical protein